MHVACGYGWFSSNGIVFTYSFMADAMFLYHGSSGLESSTTLYFRLCQVVLPVGPQTTRVYGRFHQNEAPG